LQKRGTDSPEIIENRVAKAEFELTFANKFDAVIINDNLEEAEIKALQIVQTFLNNNP
jgi:guanylate kinase